MSNEAMLKAMRETEELMRTTLCVLADVHVPKDFCENRCPLIGDCKKGKSLWMDNELVRRVKDAISTVRTTPDMTEEQREEEIIRAMGYQPKQSKENNKNPKQILIDWVDGVYEVSIHVRNAIKDRNLDLATDENARIIGMCEAMKIVLKNSD